jgi:hypothetical protein
MASPGFGFDSAATDRRIAALEQVVRDNAGTLGAINANLDAIRDSIHGMRDDAKAHAAADERMFSAVNRRVRVLENLRWTIFGGFAVVGGTLTAHLNGWLGK